MTIGSSNWSWPEVESLARLLADSEDQPVICGGQAVGFWAARYKLGGIVSRDLDVLGERDGATRFAAALGATIRYPERYEMTVLAAAIRTTWLGRTVDIEWLNSIPGIEADPEAISVVVDLGGSCLRVLHPVPLGVAKLHALRFFDQRERNDAAHLKVVIPAARERLSEELQIDAAGALRSIHRWYRATRIRGNRRILSDLNLDWRDAVPVARLEAAAGRDTRVARFLADHWPRLSAEP